MIISYCVFQLYDQPYKNPSDFMKKYIAMKLKSFPRLVRRCHVGVTWFSRDSDSM